MPETEVDYRSQMETILQAKTGMTSHNPAKGQRKAPAQERSKNLVSFIVEAGLRLLEEEGPEALTTTRVAEVAGVSVGSVYQYFSNRDAVVDAVYRHKLELEWHRAHEWGDIADLPLPEVVGVIVDKAVERHRGFLKLHKEFYRDRVHEFSLDNFGLQSEFESVAWFQEILQRQMDEKESHRAEHASYLILRGLSTVLHSTIKERPEYIFDDAFVAELKNFVTASLRNNLATSQNKQEK